LGREGTGLDRKSTKLVMTRKSRFLVQSILGEKKGAKGNGEMCKERGKGVVKDELKLCIHGGFQEVQGGKILCVNMCKGADPGYGAKRGARKEEGKGRGKT